MGDLKSKVGTINEGRDRAMGKHGLGKTCRLLHGLNNMKTSTKRHGFHLEVNIKIKSTTNNRKEVAKVSSRLESNERRCDIRSPISKRNIENKSKK